MKNLKNLLERFSRSLNKTELTKNEIIQIIKEKTKISLKQENISLKDGVLEIQGNPSIKNEIVLKQELILSELRLRRVPVSRIFYK